VHKPGINPHDGNASRRLLIEQRQAMYFGSTPGTGTHYYLYPLDAKNHSEAQPEPVSYAGALRCRVGPRIQVLKDEILLPVEVSAQPNVIWEQLKDVRVDHALDDRGQELVQAPLVAQANSIEMNRVVLGLGNGMMLNAAGGLDLIAEQGGFIRLKTGEQRSRTLESISGTITGQMRTPVQTLVAVENIRKQAGKSFHTNYGESLDVLGVSELPDGTVKLEIRLKEPPTMLLMPGNGRIAARGNLVLGGQQVVFNRLGVRTNGNLQADLRVKDEEGHSLTIEPGVQYALTLIGNMLATNVTLQIKPPHGAFEIFRLEWAGQHSTTVEVPFKFTNVPLP
jgi:hypothetical protein